MKQRPPAVLSQLPGQAVGVADGYHRQPGVPLRLEGQAVARSLAGAQGAHTGHPGPQGQHRAQLRLQGGRGAVAARAVQGDPSPGIAAGLGRQVQNAAAGLDVELAGVQAVFAQAVRRLIKPGQLGAGVFHRRPVQAVGDTQMGKEPLDAQVFHPAQAGQGCAVLRRNAQAAHPRVNGQVDADRRARGVQRSPVGLVRHRLDQPPAAQKGDLLHRGVAQNQNGSPNSRPAQGDPLGQAGHGKGPNAAFLQAPGHNSRAVAVAVRLDHRHQPAAGGQAGLQD